MSTTFCPSLAHKFAVYLFHHYEVRVARGEIFGQITIQGIKGIEKWEANYTSNKKADNFVRWIAIRLFI